MGGGAGAAIVSESWWGQDTGEDHKQGGSRIGTVLKCRGLSFALRMERCNMKYKGVVTSLPLFLSFQLFYY